MRFEMAGPPDARGAAVVLHPHPHFGGDRYHPFVAGVFQGLPEVGLGAVRFDFSTADVDAAVEEVVEAIDALTERWPDARPAIVGYSFGGGVALRVTDPRAAGWFVVAPPASMLGAPVVGPDARPKHVIVPERDQFSSLGAVEEATAEWRATTTATVADDHYLWNVMDEVVALACDWTARLVH